MIRERSGSILGSEYRPPAWGHGRIGLGALPDQSRQIQLADATVGVVLECSQPRMFVKDLRRCFIIKALHPKPLGHLGHHPPVWPRLTGRRQKPPLPGDHPLRVGYRAVLLPPGLGGKPDVGGGHRIGIGHAVGDDHIRTAQQCLTHAIGVRHGNHGIGRHDPDQLYPAGMHGLEQIDRFQPRLAGDGQAPPEPLDPIRLVKTHVGSQRRCQAPDLAPTHGVRLTGYRQGAGTGPIQASGCQVTINDGADLVTAGAGLIHALRVERDHPVRAGE